MFGLISSGYFSAVTGDMIIKLTFAPTDASAPSYTGVDAKSTAAFCMLLAAYGSQGSDLDQVFGAYRCARAHMACLLILHMPHLRPRWGTGLWPASCLENSCDATFNSQMPLL